MAPLLRAVSVERRFLTVIDVETLQLEVEC